jgi:hypothetical protein
MPEAISASLSESQTDLLAEVNYLALLANKAPREIDSEDGLSAIAKLVVDARALTKKVDDARKEAKDPYFRAGQEVDNFFRAPLERLARIRDVFQAIADKYQRAKAEAERRRREEEARAAREEETRRREATQRAEEQGQRQRAKTQTAKADAAADRADEAEAAAAAPLAAHVETRVSDDGVKAGAKGEWTFEIVDLDQIDYAKLGPFFKPEHIGVALKAAVKQGRRDFGPGVRVFETVKAVLR